jgi:L-lactate dehydrogenase complex protein LldE
MEPGSPTVALLPTCVVDTVAPDVGRATVRVLTRLGARVTVPRGATCCGQPGWNAGFHRPAARVARTTLRALSDSPADVVCVPAGSCATMIRVFWPELFHLAGDEPSRHAAERLAPRVREFSELVAELLPDGPVGRLDAGVAYHHSCHMLRELGIEEAPTSALAHVGGARVVEWSADQRCCGFGGLFSVKQPELSVAMADEKLDTLPDVERLVGCDQSCLLHLEGRLRRRGGTTRVQHLAELLDEAMEAASRGT